MTPLLPGPRPGPDEPSADSQELAELERKLRSSLHAGADPIVVDVTALRVGAHTGARLLRARRRAGILLATAVFVAVPLGVGAALATQRSAPVAAPTPEEHLYAQVTATPTLTVSATPTTTEPTATATSVTPTETSSTPTPSTSAASPTASGSPTATATHRTRHRTWDGSDFGDDLGLGYEGAPLGFDVVDSLDLGPSAGMDPPVMGQMCNNSERASRPGPIVSRQWGWWGHGYAVHQVITGYERGTGLARFADISEDDGRCRWIDPQRVVRSNAREWFAVEKRGRYSFARGAVLRGDVILSLEVTHPEGTAAALGMLDRLMDDLIDRWEQSH